MLMNPSFLPSLCFYEFIIGFPFIFVLGIPINIIEMGSNWDSQYKILHWELDGIPILGASMGFPHDCLTTEYDWDSQYYAGN